MNNSPMPWDTAVAEAKRFASAGAHVNAAEKYTEAADLAEAVQMYGSVAQYRHLAGAQYLAANLSEQAIGPSARAVELLANQTHESARAVYIVSLGNFGLAKLNAGHPPEEIIPIQLEMVRVFEDKGGVTEDLGKAYLNLADTYRRAGQRDAAHENYSKAVEVFKKLGIGNAVHRATLGRDNTKPPLQERIRSWLGAAKG